MCGIIGYIGNKECSDILLDGLTRLEYRGYDSAGIALLNKGVIDRYRANGKLKNLKKIVYGSDVVGNIGIGHTRWATHGAPSEKNAHPHKANKFVIVHNGIIENYRELKTFLISKGIKFSSETDSEIIAYLIEYYFNDNNSFEVSVSKAIKELEGAFAVLVLKEDEEKIIAFKRYSPLILGVGEDETFIASDIPAVLSHTNDFIYLEDGEMVIVDKSGFKITDFELNEVEFEIKKLNISPIMAEKGNYKHFMLKEIFEQSRSIADTFRGRILHGGEDLDLEFDKEFDQFLNNKLNRVVITACGTSWHSGLLGKYFIEQIARTSVEVDYASEYRYREPILDENTLLIAISQSGETADTLAAVNMAKERGAKVLSICNVFNSTIPRKSDAVLYTYAGPEIGVASTKAFTTQISIIILIAIYLKNLRTKELDRVLLKELLTLSEKISKILEDSEIYHNLAEKYHNYDDFLYLGRGVNFPIALEGALKLKEISYIHAEGYPSGEMKHGPIALIDEKMPTFIIATDGNHYEKVLSNLQEIRAREGKILSIATDGNKEILDSCDDVIYIPKSHPILEPFLNIIPMQLFAYYVADIKGTDVDQPRNLAKSVTVE